MIKILLSITAVALLAAAVLGIQNRNNFIEARKARAENNKKIDTIQKKIETVEVPALKGDDGAFEHLWKAENLLAQHEADLEQAKINIATLDTEINGLNGQMAPLDSEIAKVDEVIEKLRAKFPGVTLENIGATIKQLESDVDDAKQELAAKQGEIEIVSKKVAANESQIQRREVGQVKRLAGIGRNATEGVITAVNRDWGFVVVNIGSKQGISGDSRLIVKRSGSRIADLSIVSVKPGITVADIRQDSLTGVVQPGDRVIFKNLGE
jgi:hypothetical protein